MALVNLDGCGLERTTKLNSPGLGSTVQVPEPVDPPCVKLVGVRVLGIDFGGKHIGLATGESEFRIVSAKPNLGASGTLALDAKTLVEIAVAESADAIVIGLALDLGEETKMSRICRMLGDEIIKLGMRVEYVDESLTSGESEQAMQEAGLKGSDRRKRVDGEAACRILERFFDQER